MRLFVAFELPEAARQALASWVVAQRGDSPPARWVRPQLMHLTLRFIGDTEPDRLPELEEALAAAFADGSPIAMHWTGVGTFPPNGRRARTLWAGVAADPGLMRVRKSVDGAVRATLPSAHVDRGSFLPHITLARCAPPWPVAATARLRASGQVLSRVPFRIAEGTLLSSELRPEGPLHTAVATFPMRGGA